MCSHDAMHVLISINSHAGATVRLVGNEDEAIGTRVNAPCEQLLHVLALDHAGFAN